MLSAFRRNPCPPCVGFRTIAKDAAIEPHVDERLTPESQVAAVQLEQCVRKAVAQLSNEQLRVIELSFFEDKPHGEIAELLQIPLGTVKSRLRLAIARLRALLGDIL